MSNVLKPKTSHGNKVEDTSSQHKSGGKLTTRLIDQGLLTKNMVTELQREWENKASKDEHKLKRQFELKSADNPDGSSNSSRKK